MFQKFVCRLFAAFSALLLLTMAALASQPLVDASWIKANLGKTNISFIDLRPKSLYLQGHVPGAIHSSYKGDKWRMKKGEVKGMLPPVAHLEALIGRLGIGDDTHVVLMHGGFSAAETGIATRIYWTLKYLGHDEVSILNGGMKAWLKDKSNPLEKGAVNVAAKPFMAKINNAVLATADDVVGAISAKTTLLDSRPTDQHLGINKSGSITRTGTLPGAISLPGRWMTINDKGAFRGAEALASLYKAQNATASGNSIVFCNTGHWASLGWFVESELMGNKASKMYDGSMAEWSRLSKDVHPMTVKLAVN